MKEQKSRHHYFCILAITIIALYSFTSSLLISRITFEASFLGKRMKTEFSLNNDLPPWTFGTLDIHHIRSGTSQSTFIIFPDSTTLLVDAGDFDQDEYETWKQRHPGFHMKPHYPNKSKTSAGWIIDYVKDFWPQTTREEGKNLDYVIVTHFHTDHIGYPSASRLSRSGISEIGKKIKMRHFVDRAYPEYDFPVNLTTGAVPTFGKHGQFAFDKYKIFVEESVLNGRIQRAERFDVGSASQIRMRHNGAHFEKAGFRVRNIKNNLEVSDALSSNVKTIPGRLFLDDKKNRTKWDENEMSIAFVIEYGDFRYYEGGDQESHDYHDGPDSNTKKVFDTITPTAMAVGGPVNVATLNHHGHGVNDKFVEILDPKVAILQGWCSDQPPDHSMDLLLANNHVRRRDIFATDIFESRLRSMGLNRSNGFVSTSGHVVVRVPPPPHLKLDVDDSVDSNGGNHSFFVYVLDADRKVATSHGPYDVSQ